MSTVVKKNQSEVSPTRRKLLNAVWVPPVVLSVNLPAHAETSFVPTPMPVSSCGAVVVGASTITFAGADQLTTDLPLDITITNSGETPLASLQASDTNQTPGLSLSSPDFVVTGVEFSPNSSIPNPLMPGQSVTIQLTSFSVDTCPVNGTLNIEFSPDETECSASVEVVCVPPVLSCNVGVMFAPNNNGIGLLGPNFQTIEPVDITISNIGEAPLSSGSTSDTAGLLITSPDFTPTVSVDTSINGPIPNPLLPGQSHTVRIVSVGIDICPVMGVLEVSFDREGISCSNTIDLVCIEPAP